MVAEFLWWKRPRHPNTTFVYSMQIGSNFRCHHETFTLQDHYDYGMRAVKSVIVAAGNLKRNYPDEDEDVLLLRGLRDINVPKFLSHDLPLFAGIITDLFPGVKPPDISYDDLLGALAIVSKELKIMPVEPFTSKVLLNFHLILVVCMAYCLSCL